MIAPDRGIRRQGSRRTPGERIRGAATRLGPALVLLLAAACGGEDAPAAGDEASAPASRSASADTAPLPPIAAGAAPLVPVTAAAGELPGRFGFGRAADPAEIARLEVDVLPDGSGLPGGRGTVAEGAEVYRTRCASCHGVDGRNGPFDPLVSPPGEREFPSSRGPSPPTTVGNYWPHATSLFEYVARAMPMQAPGTLEADEIYAVVAWLLHRNGIVGEDAVMDPGTLPEVRMPARDRFVVDDRTGGPGTR